MKKDQFKPPLEYDECVVFAEYLTAKGLKFTHLAQETFTKNWGTKMKNKRMGVMPGVPDYLILIPQKGIVFIEMKRIKGGVVSPQQEEWIEELNKFDGCEAAVCRGAEEAIKLIDSICD